MKRWRIENSGWILESFTGGMLCLTLVPRPDQQHAPAPITLLDLDDGCLDDLRRILNAAREMDAAVLPREVD